MELNFNIFISHDSSDETIAIELKKFLENIFLNASVYVSGRDLQGGQTWIENIKISLKTSQVIISVITEKSINNNWIYFETGAGFTEDKSIPLLADNLKFSDLKPPLSLLQSRTLTKAGIESLISDIASKLNLRIPKNLTGLEELLDESNKFFALRNLESSEPKTSEMANKVVAKKSSPVIIQVNDNDPELEEKYNKTVQRTIDLIKRKILTYKDKLDIPREEELEGLKINQIQEVARAYNIPTPTGVVVQLLVANLSFPGKDSKSWEKMNTQKTIQDSNLELDKYEKQI